MTPAPAPPDAFDRRLLVICGLVLAVIVAVSTPVHYLWPGLLRVPSTPVPGSDLLSLLTMEVLTLVMTALCAAHCLKKFGAYSTVLFLVGSFFYTGALENLMILTGRFGVIPFETYYFGKGGLLWFVEVPISVCLGWFVLAYGSFFIAHTVFTKVSPYAAAAIAAFICMDLDLMYDPVMTQPSIMAWTWLQPKGSTTELFSIPLYNFIGWFGIIFLFEVLWVQAPKWTAALGKAKATRRFFLSTAGMIAIYYLVVIGGEILIRKYLPGIDIGGLS